jgi:hypothetical protein
MKKEGNFHTSARSTETPSLSFAFLDCFSVPFKGNQAHPLAGFPTRPLVLTSVITRNALTDTRHTSGTPSTKQHVHGGREWRPDPRASRHLRGSYAAAPGPPRPRARAGALPAADKMEARAAAWGRGRRHLRGTDASLLETLTSESEIFSSLRPPGPPGGGPWWCCGW